MKQLKSYMVLGIGGGDRISYTFDEVDDTTGQPVKQNQKGNFYAVDQELQEHVEFIRNYIKTHKLGGME